jgi:hypothetical protein
MPSGQGCLRLVADGGGDRAVETEEGLIGEHLGANRRRPVSFFGKPVGCFLARHPHMGAARADEE